MPLIAPLLSVALLAQAPAPPERLPAGDYTPQPERKWVMPAASAGDFREDALRRAAVWRAPSGPIPQVDFTRNPAEEPTFDPGDVVACRFLVTEVDGRTPKFRCALADGHVIKVKYGAWNAEVAGEVAASRLLAALGFGADDMSVVRAVRCFGCPRFPFETLSVTEALGAEPIVEKVLDYDRYVDFDRVVVERPARGLPIVTPTVQGWAFYELSRIESRRGGAPRVHVDALRLMAVFLAHWDNKSENQRLVCLSAPPGSPPGRCARPFAMLQDVGATFGPEKVSLKDWAAAPIWQDRASCVVSMRPLPYEGATFPEVRIGEAGRRFLSDRLEQLSVEQIRALFATARVTDFDQSAGRNVEAWVETFQRKVREIGERRCTD
jgi:hypothetical protein